MTNERHDHVFAGKITGNETQDLLSDLVVRQSNGREAILMLENPAGIFFADDAEHEKPSAALVKHDPTDVEENRKRDQASAKRDEEGDGLGAASDAHGGYSKASGGKWACGGGKRAAGSGSFDMFCWNRRGTFFRVGRVSSAVRPSVFLWKCGF